MATNLFPDPSIESSADYWNSKDGAAVVQSSDAAWHGTYSLKVTPQGTSGNPTWYEYGGCSSDVISVSSSTQYTLSYYWRVTNGSNQYNEIVRDQDNNNITYTLSVSGTADTWVRRSLTFTTGGDDTGVKLVIEKDDEPNTDPFYLDGVQLETGASASEWVNNPPDSNELVIADSAHAHTAENITLTQAQMLVIANASHAHAVDSIVLEAGVVYALSGSILVPAIFTGSLNLIEGVTLEISDSSHAHTTENLGLVQAQVLVIDDAGHAHAAGNVSLTQAQVLSIANSGHVHTADSIVLSASEVISVDVNRIARIIFVLK